MDDKSGEILTENGKTDENGIDAAGIDVAGIDTAEIDENGENSSNEAEVEVDSSDADESENESSDDEIETSTKQNIDMTQTDTIDMVSQSGEVNENHGNPKNLNLNLLKRLNIDYDLSDLLLSRNKSAFVVDCKINDSGMLTVVLSNSRAYQYNTDNKCWTSLMGGNFQPIFYDKNAYIQAGSLTLNSENRFESNLVCWAQNEALKVGESKNSNNFPSTETETSKLGLMVGTSLSGNITFMQSQVETAISSDSSSEWRHWMVVYVRFLVMCCNSPSMVDSCKVRISGILEDMLGPSTVELDEIDNVMMEEEDRNNEIETNSWKPKMLGVDKRVFLKEQVLPLMSKSVHLQRLYQEFNEQL